MTHILRTVARLVPALIIALTLTATTVGAHDEFRFVGSLVKVDAAKNLVSVKYKEFDGKEATVVVTLMPKTTITRDGKPVAKSQLRAGLHVVVDALGCEDDYEATAIKIVPAPK
jgi:hypothetical protein